MALEESTPGEYAAWLLVAAGLWALASPFVYGDSVSGPALNNYVGVGVVVTTLAAFVAYSVRS